MTLEEIRPTVEHIVTAASEAFQVESAVFSEGGSLFFCTPTYRRKKGNAIHQAFIQNVMEQGNILVTDPGKMPSCRGCRFSGHCPSTMEILCCIHAGTRIAGVVSFTVFTKKGQRQLTEHTSIYLDSVSKLASLIGQYLTQDEKNQAAAEMDELTEAMMEMCAQPLLLTDTNGVILRCNGLAANALKFCNIRASSLRQMFDEELVLRITSGNDVRAKTVAIGDKTARVTSRAVYADGHVVSVLVRLSNEFLDGHPETASYRKLIGESKSLQEIRHVVRRVAVNPTPVLLTGETGTGKELVARAIHEESDRRNYPFVAINCSSIPENLFESELFGYEEGAFTGAKKGGKAGKIELAQGGTLFLDEIGEMPLSVQPKLLRVLQEHELERVGSAKKIYLDIRVITATNQDLREMIRKKTFREDLFYRIGVINLKLPPLRERTEDILPITQDYLMTLRTKMRTPLQKLSSMAERILLAHSWPGNIRELQNVLEYAANLCETDTLLPQDLPEYLRRSAGADLKTPQAGEVDAAEDSSAPSSADKRLLELLAQYGETLEGKKKAAAAMGISLRTLYRKIDKLAKKHFY